MRKRAASIILSGTFFAACSEKPSTSRQASQAATKPVAEVADPTFARNVAPIIFANCSGCHRPNESAPFALIDYEDVRKRGEQIVEVIESGYMPPWLPSSQNHAFAEDRRMSKQQKDLIVRWVAQGSELGNLDDLPEPPAWPQGWQLGDPDLILDLPGDYVLPAEGADVFRSFVLPVSLETPRFVRAVEIRPGNSKIIHHGVLLKDRTQAGRELDAADPGPGYAGMQQPHLITSPDGHFVGWTPGKIPKASPADMAWRLDPGTDLVAALHMLPSGKPETLRLRVGLYFSDTPPSRKPAMIELENQTIDIPAGESAYTISDTFTLPVDVNVLGIYPHAHYLAREMHVAATSPTGKRIELLHIAQWDFNWQDDYRYEKPVALPRGSRVEMQFIYDNSTENERNPFSPPQRITYGELSTNEMGSLWLQVLPRRAADLESLQKAIAAKSAAQAMAGFHFALTLNPNDPEAHNNLGAILSLDGKFDEARIHFESALAAEPNHVATHFNFGLMLSHAANPADAKKHFEKAVSLDPSHAGALSQLGSIAANENNHAAAIGYFERALSIKADRETYYNLGVTYISLGQYHDAIRFLEKAAQLNPSDMLTQLNLGACFFNGEDWVNAAIHFRRTTELAPGFLPGHLNLGNALIKQDRVRDAIACFQRATQLDPGNRQAWESLQAAQQLLNER